MPLLSPSDTRSNQVGSNPAPKRNLLIVDDEEGPRQSLRVIFKDEYHTILAEHGAKAIELARENPVDVAILDIRMSGMSGIELLGRLKEIDPTTEVIMLTAYETIETARQALRLGACDYLNKPFDIATMRQAVRNAVERRSVNQTIKSSVDRLHQLENEIHNHHLREEIARTQGEIYASIIHDINGPLTVISGFIEVINSELIDAEKIEGEDLASLKERIARISRQVTNCIEISRRYLSFLQDKNRADLAVGVNQILSDLRELLRVHPSLKNNELRIESLREDAKARINGTDLLQILLNLTINALQASHQPHEVNVTAKVLSAPLEINKLEQSPGNAILMAGQFNNQPPIVALTISDKGAGIPPENLKRVFDTYFTTKPAGQGTGLGLAIVRRLVEQSSGAIYLISYPGKGTAVTVYFPGR